MTMKMETRSRAIDKVYKRRDRIEMPDFQREEVWSDKKKKLLIDSILQGWHLPKFYFRKIDDQAFECVDGQQRLTAIFEFCDNKLELNEDTTTRYNGAKKYEDLPDDVSDEFDDFEIDIEEIEDADDHTLEELFQRLQLGTPLNTAEKLNAILGDLRDFCFEISEKPFFDQKIGLKNTRYSHFEIVTRWIFVEARGIHPQMRFPQLESLLKDNRTFSKESDTAKRIIKAIDYLNKAFEQKSKVVRNRANTLSVCMLASRVVSQGFDVDTAKNFSNFVDHFFERLTEEVEKGVKSKARDFLRYQQAITSGSTGGDSIKQRIRILTKNLVSYSPRFSKLFGAYEDSSDEAAHGIQELVTYSRDLVYNINRSYSAKNGEDLFKMSTEASAALTTIQQPTRDSDKFATFIDALYFLIYEGSGSCKRFPQPPPEFSMNIKFLRTLFRHDVDHGTDKEIAAKKLRNAEVFEKYSGKKTPGECSAEDFLTAQIRMLEGLVSFLLSLSPK
jgi:hypothetical protein